MVIGETAEMTLREVRRWCLPALARTIDASGMPRLTISATRAPEGQGNQMRPGSPPRAVYGAELGGVRVRWGRTTRLSLEL